MVSSQLDSLQVFRGIAAVAVVFFHIAVIAETKLNTSFIGGFFDQGHYGVDFFFVLSGFIIAYVHLKDVNHPETVPRYLAKRFLRIVPLLTLINVIKTVYILIGLPGVPEEKVNFVSIATSFLMLPSEELPLVDVAWTLRHEGYFYLLFTIVILFPKKVSLGVGAVIVSGTIMLSFVKLNSSDFLLAFIFSPFNMQFLIGVVAAVFVRRGKLLPFPEFWLLGSAGIMGILLSNDFWTEWPEILVRIVWGLIFAVFVLGGVSIDQQRDNIRFPTWLKLLGNTSFSVYLFHTSFQMLLCVVYQKIGRSSNSTEQLILFLGGVISIFGGLLVWKFIESPLNKHFRSWTELRRIEACKVTNQIP